jgi:hypothetical protein
MDFGVSSQQLAVISALSSGATLTAAAEQAGIHRNTIHNWRRNSPPFQEAFAHAQYDRALFFREKMEAHIDLALQTLQNLLTDPKTPASVRLRAALAIIGSASTPPPPKQRVEPDIEKVVIPRTPPQVIAEEQLGAMPNHAQSAQPDPPPAVHPPATIRRETPKIGRNDVCPCGSGRKFKRCCLNNPAGQPQQAAAA